MTVFCAGGKMSWFEGGIRTSAWVTGGVLPPAMRGKNLSSSHLIAVCDWHSTFLALAGAAGSKAHHDGEIESGVVLEEEETRPRGAVAARFSMLPPPLPTLDGIDQWPVISGERSTPLRSEVFVGSDVLVYRNYKLIATAAGDARWSGAMYPKVPATGSRNISCSNEAPCLFDVVQDLRWVTFLTILR